MSSCVGCGYCCKAAQCMLGQRVHGRQEICPDLIFRSGRYWCVAALQGGSDLRDDLSIGAGCCSGLNTERLKYHGMDLVDPPTRASLVVSSELLPRGKPPDRGSSA